ncbi:MAG: undecaprenyldiphospho-muramoylpentapeptide beta-N-acetylglucosaminyltransferase [Desulfovibrio sp.]|nr:undecaprenyldiphospho-muramoylpentapeptide beta-N-acetylglucosaminyltransferase [Desulfovibrio sp.]
MQRVLLTTGGTGGHIFPALAVAEELRRRHPGIGILFMGSDYGPEKRLCERAGIAFEGLPVRGFLGRGLRGVAALARMLLAIPRARGIVSRFNPDAACGFGSYAAFAPLLAARLCGVPCVMHEQNAVAGASNRFLARFMDAVCVSLPGTRGFEGRRIVVTGNPVRAGVFAVKDKPRDFAGRRVLLVGGSLGAHALNRLMVGILPALREAGVCVRHQTGVKDEAEVKQAYADAGMDASLVSAFIDDMAQAYAWADLVLCRAGASTVAEICGAGLPSVLVPYPYAAHDHQTGNAKALESAGAARLLPERDLDEAKLADTLLGLLADPGTLKAMSEKALALAAPGAAAGVADQIEEAWRRAEG